MRITLQGAVYTVLAILFLGAVGLSIWELSLNGWHCSQDTRCWGHVGAMLLTTIVGIVLVATAGYALGYNWNANPSVEIFAKKSVPKAKVVR